MAKSENSVISCKLSRKIGNLPVFRQVDGKTIVSKIPEQPKNSVGETKNHAQTLSALFDS
jgi:hypothetical protein